MRPQEMMQDVQCSPHMHSIAAGLGLTHVVDDHFQNPVGAAFMTDQVLGQVLGKCGRGHLGKVLMLGDRENNILT